MNQIIKIGNQELSVKEFNSRRVTTFKDIDLVHERPEGTAKRNFATNRDRFVEGEDFIEVSASDVGTDFVLTYGFVNKAAKGFLITEQGYLMLVKSFTDDLAWDVQRQLVNTYFKVKKPLSAIEQLQLTQQAILEVKADVDSVNDDLQTFKKDMPLLALETERIVNAVKRIGVHCLGGKDSDAYQDKSLRGQVYSDIYGQLKREFGVNTYKAIKRSQCDMAVETVIEYKLPLALSNDIDRTNAQLKI